MPAKIDLDVPEFGRCPVLSGVLRRGESMKNNSLRKLLKEIDEDEDGSISLETILIIGAIALPILIFLLVKAWPTIKAYFNQGLEDLTNDANNVPT
jgi:hypothetical protein